MSAALLVEMTCHTYGKIIGYTLVLVYADFIKYAQLIMICWIHFLIYNHAEFS